jgi:hypothetical protein
MNSKIFTVEYAPTSFCECDFCEDKILKKEIRISQLFDTAKVRRICLNVLFKEDFVQIFFFSFIGYVQLVSL